MKYCSRCKRWKARKQFIERQDRDTTYSWCRKCMDRSPLYSRVFVNDGWIKVLDRESRAADYPIEEERGFGAIY